MNGCGEDRGERFDFCERGDADALRLEAAEARAGTRGMALAGCSKAEELSAVENGPVREFGVKARVVAAMSVYGCCRVDKPLRAWIKFGD